MSREDFKVGVPGTPRTTGSFAAITSADAAPPPRITGGFPAVTSPPEPIAQDARPSGAQRKLRRRKVMVVDDDPTVLNGVAAFLEAAGYEVVARAEALGTMVAISRENPDIVVMDVEMPGLSGDAISALLARRKHPLCVIFHSSRPRSELERMARETSARGAIPKGDLREFLTKFEALLPPELRVRA
ncbi:MAG: response regulator [Myxococcales bacterium]